MCVSGGMNISFSKNFVYVLNGWCLAKIVNSFYPLTIFAKSSVIDVSDASTLKNLKNLDLS